MKLYILILFVAAIGFFYYQHLQKKKDEELFNLYQKQLEQSQNFSEQLQNTKRTKKQSATSQIGSTESVSFENTREIYHSVNKKNNSSKNSIEKERKSSGGKVKKNKDFDIESVVEEDEDSKSKSDTNKSREPSDFETSDDEGLSKSSHLINSTRKYNNYSNKKRKVNKRIRNKNSKKFNDRVSEGILTEKTFG